MKEGALYNRGKNYRTHLVLKSTMLQALPGVTGAVLAESVCGGFDVCLVTPAIHED